MTITVILISWSLKYLCDPDINSFVYILLLFLILRSCNAVLHSGYVYLLTNNTQDSTLFTFLPTLVLCIFLIMVFLMGMKLYHFVTLIYSSTVIGILVISHWCSIVSDMNHSKPKLFTLAFSFRILSVIMGILWRSRDFCSMVSRKQRKKV